MCHGCDDIRTNPAMPIRPQTFVPKLIAEDFGARATSPRDDDYICRGCGTLWAFDGLLSKWQPKAFDS